MAIYRKLQTTFWTDTKVVDDFTPEDRYFYIYLLTNPHTNLCGCYEISMKQMADETGYSKETIQKLLGRMSKIHKTAFYDEQTREVLVINWHKYNWTSSPKFRKPVGLEIEKVKNAEFKRFLTESFNNTDTVSIPYPYPMDTTVTVTVSDTVSDTASVNTNGGEKTKAKRNDYPEKFEQFYQAYPRKKEKAGAYKCYQARVKDGWTEDELIKAAKVYAEECVRDHRPEKYIKLPATFLGPSTPFTDYLEKPGQSVTASGYSQELLDRLVNERREDLGE